MYLRSFEYFRAVTIVLIVMGHCYGISGWELDSFWDRVLANMISGGTSLFVFISGFLFYHVFYPKFVYIKFMEKKIKNVYIPYLILSIIPVCIALYTRIPYEEFYFGPQDTIYDQIIRPVLLHYWYGGVMVYWYIPFIMAMYIISPVFIWYIHRSLKEKIYIVCILTLISIFMHRPVNNWSIVQSVLYFSPVYMFGILCSMEREWIYEKLKGKDYYLLSFVIFLAFLQAFVMDTCGNMQKNPFDYNGIDISFLQKNVLCLFFMVFLHRFEDKEFMLLKHLAVSSFSIYFLHGWFILFIWQGREYYEKYDGLYTLPLFTALVVWVSYVTAVRIKKVFPNKSRMLIGW
ncbi:MAG: acyltransferase [Desulfomicrobium sp.]|nr:acyltransferase [Desulfomicrobium sp.]